MTSGSNSTLSVVAPAGVSNVTAADLIKTFKTGSHYVGTAKIGTKGDAGVVVDTNTKVYGTDNLFVVDASIHPDLPTGNTQAIIMVAAEAAAAKILALGGSNATAPSTPATSAAAEATSAAAIPSSTGSPVISSAAPVSTAPVATSAPAASSPAASAAPSAPAESAPATPVESSPATAPTESSPATSVAGAYERCGGIGFTGPTTCTQGWTCKKQNDYYSQCLQGISRRESAPVVRRDIKKLNRVAQRATFLDMY
jgi:cellobiose dehydrogenase (acceptor)